MKGPKPKHSRSYSHQKEKTTALNSSPPPSLPLNRIKNQEQIDFLESKESLFKSQEFAHIGSWEWDLPNNKIAWSPELYRIYDIDPQTQLNWNKLMEKVHPDDRDYYNKIVDDWMKNCQGGTFEYRILRSDGSIRFLCGEGVVTCDNTGKPVRTFGVVQDITERKQVEEALREEKDKAQNYLNVAGVILVVLNADQTVSLINKKGCEVLGYKESDIIGKNWFDNFLPENIRDQTKAGFARLIAGEIETTEYYENPVITKEGQEKTISWYNSLLRNEAGEIVATLSSGEDMTERKQAEDELVHYRQHLEELVKDRTAELIETNDQLKKEIAKRKRIEQALLKSEKEQKIDNQISKIFLTIPDDDMYSEVLQIVLEAVGSKFGVFGFIDENGNFVCPSMTRDVWDHCQVSNKAIVFPPETWGGIWGRSLKEKKTLYSDGPFTVPQGHLPITRILCIPIIYKQNIIGVFQLANKATVYDKKDITFLENIANHVAPVLHARLERDRQEKKRKQAERELFKQQYFLSKAQEIGKIGTWELDIRENILVWTDENYRIFGLPMGTPLTYETFLDCVHPDDRKYVDKEWKAAFNKKPYDIEHRLLMKDGSIKWVREKAELEFDEQGNCLKGTGFTQDITESKQAEEERNKLLYDMGERVKELTCMYGVAKSIRNRTTLKEIFQDVIHLIPTGWQYPEITCCRIRFNGKEYISKAFEETKWKLAKGIIVNGKRKGSIEVFYREERPLFYKGPFLKEECNLIKGIASTLSETIERKQAEKELKKSEKRFRAMFEQAAVGVAQILTETGRYLRINQRYCDIVGYTPEEMLELTFQDITHPEDLQADLDNKQKIREGKISDFSMEKRYIRKDGSPVWVNVTVSSMGEIREQPNYYIAVVEDISERKRAEEKVKESEEKYRMLIKTSNDAVFLAEAETGTIIEANKKAELLLGRPQEEIIGMHYSQLHPPNEIGCCGNDFLNLIEEGGNVLLCANVLHKDGHKIPVEISGSDIWIKDKRIVQGIFRDISERKKAEEEIKARQLKIEEINANLEKRVQEEVEMSRQKDYIMIRQSRLAAMGEMIRFITHQWGQPLWALQLLFHNIEDSIEDSEINQEDINELIANGFAIIKRIVDTMNDFKNFFQADKEKVTFSINKNVKDTLSLLGANFKYSNISIILNEKEELMVSGFPNEFSQVILNILNNSKDAIVEKGIKGEIKMDFLCKDDSAVVRIKDNGGGIPEDSLDKIFDPYFTTKKEGKGTGIGLYMSKMIVKERMNGWMNVKNTKTGAEFEIKLPLIRS